MSIARQFPGRRAVWLIVAALALFAALSLSISSAPLRQVFVLPGQTHSAPAIDSRSGQGLTPRSAQPSSSVQSSVPAPAAAPQQTGPQAAPGTTGPGSAGGTGFADSGTGSAGTAQAQKTGCGLTSCTHPK